MLIQSGPKKGPLLIVSHEYLIFNRAFRTCFTHPCCAQFRNLRKLIPRKAFLQIRRSTNLRAALLKAGRPEPLRSPANYQVRDLGASILPPGEVYLSVDAVATYKKNRFRCECCLNQAVAESPTNHGGSSQLVPVP